MEWHLFSLPLALSSRVPESTTDHTNRPPPLFRFLPVWLHFSLSLTALPLPSLCFLLPMLFFFLSSPSPPPPNPPFACKGGSVTAAIPRTCQSRENLAKTAPGPAALRASASISMNRFPSMARTTTTVNGMATRSCVLIVNCQPHSNWPDTAVRLTMC